MNCKEFRITFLCFKFMFLRLCLERPYKEGKGLGCKGQGIMNPIEVVERP
jgi:hypothetical protein